MRVVGLLSWFDEDPDLLHRAVASHAQHLDHLIALDGRYAAYPAERTCSSADEYRAIRDAAPSVDVVPAGEPWDGPFGGEVAKRAHLFRLGEAVTTAADWYWVFDGDMVLRHADPDWRDTLAATKRHSAEVEVVERHRRIPHTCLFRALRGLTVTNVHWRYHVPNGPELWGPLSPAPECLSEQVVVEHRDFERERGRVAQRRRYYRTRDRLRIERPDEQLRRAEERIRAERKQALHNAFMAVVKAAHKA